MKNSLITILQILCVLFIVGCDNNDSPTPDNTIYQLTVTTNFPCEISDDSEFTYEVKNTDGSQVSYETMALPNGQNNFNIPIKIGQTYHITAIGDFTGLVELCIESGLLGDVKTSVNLSINSSAAKINNSISQSVNTNGFSYSYTGNISAN